jgi:hypothetical protein
MTKRDGSAHVHYSSGYEDAVKAATHVPKQRANPKQVAPILQAW